MSDFIKDGTGRGYATKVTSTNRLVTDALTQPVSSERSLEGKLFGTGTGSVTLSGSESLAPMLWLRNDDADNLFLIQKLIFGWNGGSTNYNRTVLSFIRYQDSEPSANRTDAAPAIENISKSGTTSAVTDSKATAWKWNGSGSSGMTVGTAGYLQIPNRLAQGNTSIPIDGEIILGQNDTMTMCVTPEEAGEFNVAIVYYKVSISGRENE